jgi:hypothetical protein
MVFRSLGCHFSCIYGLYFAGHTPGRYRYMRKTNIKEPMHYLNCEECDQKMPKPLVESRNSILKMANGGHTPNSSNDQQ